MIAEGQGDSEEADALRDEMDWPERQLSYDEMQRLRGLSADLYMLQDDEVYEPLQPGEDPAERAPDRLRARLTEVWERGDAEATLALLRKGSAGLTQGEVGHIRSWAYEALGHPDTALLFKQYAAAHGAGENDSSAGVPACFARLTSE